MTNTSRFARWLVLAGVVVLTACSGTSTVEQGGDVDARAWAFERDVTPFPVLDADGEPYTFPFLGGFNVPRPQFADIDGDGDPDLFVQEASGEVMFFENTGTPTAPAFTFRTAQFAGIDVGDWFRFGDLDQDGDYDLLAESPYSYIRYWRNDGSAEQPAFVMAADTLRDADGDPIFSDRQNIPNITDLDCDGMPDLFLGRLDGTVSRYEATGDGLEVPRFELVAPRFEDIEVVAQIAQPGSWHGANTLVFFDYDSDGDSDLFWGDFFEPGLLLIENRGSCRLPSYSSEYQPFPLDAPISTSGYNAPTFTDVDGDGDEDLFVGVIGGAFNPNRTARANFYFLENTDAGYELRTRRFLDQIDVGNESATALGDVDGDGDLDLVVTNKLAADAARTSRMYVFANEGTPTAPRLVLDDSLSFVEAYHYAPVFGDLDGDGDDDLLLGTWNDGLFLYLNEKGTFDGSGDPFLELSRGSHASPALGDLDGDGDLDLIAGETSGELNYWRNDGTPTAPIFTLVSDNYSGIDAGRRSAPALTDADGDGDLDLYVGTEGDGVLFYRNTGTPTEPRFELQPASGFPTFRYARPAFGDLDGDGAAEGVFGGGGGGVYYFDRR